MMWALFTGAQRHWNTCPPSEGNKGYGSRDAGCLIYILSSVAMMSTCCNRVNTMSLYDDIILPNAGVWLRIRS